MLQKLKPHRRTTKPAPRRHRILASALLGALALLLASGGATAQTAPTFSAKSDFSTGDDPLSMAVGDLNGGGEPTASHRF